MAGFGCPPRDDWKSCAGPLHRKSCRRVDGEN
jgi:hypothetical protein